MKYRNFKVYRFKTIDGVVIYVGFTGKDIKDRFLEHARDKYWIHQVAEVEECPIENEAQARIVEMQYININKPVFNLKDKFPGAVHTKLRPRDKKFSHSFYLINGMPTTCPLKTNNNYTLVDYLLIEGQHVGLYYNALLNLFYSVNDICKLLNIDIDKIKELAKGSKNILKTSYTVTKNGKEKDEPIYLCRAEALDDILNLSSSDLVEKCKERFSLSSKFGDLNVLCKDKKDLYSLKRSYYKHIWNLSNKRSDSAFIRRSLIFKSLRFNIDIKDVVHAYNKSMEEFDKRFTLENTSSDIFSMVDDIVNEYNITYKDVFKEFDQYLNTYYKISFWNILSNVRKFYDDFKIQPHRAVVLQGHNLIEQFTDFYNKKI